MTVTVLPKSSADWGRIVELVIILLSVGIAWGSLKAQVDTDHTTLDRKADSAIVAAQYESLLDAIHEVQRRLDHQYAP